MTDTTLDARQRRQSSAWNRFPVWLIIAMGLVVAVNARFIAVAYNTFPGTPTADDFDTSNDYNRVLAAVDRQNALGWRVRANDAGATPVIALADRQGQPLAGATVRANARRPLGNEADVPVVLNEVSPGQFALDTPLRAGQWDLLLRISADGHEMRVTRRVLAR